MPLKGHWVNGSGGGATLATDRYIIPQVHHYRPNMLESNRIWGWYAGHHDGYTSTYPVVLLPQWSRFCKQYKGSNVYYCDHPPTQLGTHLSISINSSNYSLARWTDTTRQVKTTTPYNYNYTSTGTFLEDNVSPQVCKIDIRATARSYISNEPFDIELDSPPVFPLAGGTTGLGGGTGTIKQQTKYISYSGGVGGGGGGAVTPNQFIYPCETDYETPAAQDYAVWALQKFFSYSIVNRGYATDYDIIKFAYNHESDYNYSDNIGLVGYPNLFGISGLRKDGHYPLTTPIVGPQHFYSMQIGSSNPWGSPSTGPHYIQWVYQPQLFINTPQGSGDSRYGAPNFYYYNGLTYTNPGTEVGQWLPTT